MPQGQRDELDELADQVYGGQATAVDELDALAEQVYGAEPKKKGLGRKALELGEQAVGGVVEGVGVGISALGEVSEKLEEKLPRMRSWGALFGGEVPEAESTFLKPIGRAVQEAAPPPRPGLLNQAARGTGRAVALMGAGVGGRLGMAAAGVLATGYIEGEASRSRALAKGADTVVADRAFWDAATRPWTIASGASEMVPIGRIMFRVDRFTGGLLKKAVKNLVVEGAEEAVQEVGSEFVSILNENLDADEQRSLREILATEQARLARAGLVGMIAVSPLSFVASAVNFKLAQPAGADTKTRTIKTASGSATVTGDAALVDEALGPEATAQTWTTGQAAGTDTKQLTAPPAPTAPAGVAPLAQEPPVAQDAAPIPSPEEGAVGPEPIAPRSGPRPLISELEERYADSEIAPLPEGSVEAESGEQAISRVAQELREVGEPEAARALEASQEKRPLTRADRARRKPVDRAERAAEIAETGEEDPTLMHAGISTPEVGALIKRFTGMPTESDTGSLVPPEQTGHQRTRQEVQASMEPFERAAASSGRKEFQTVAERATTYQDRAAYRWDKIREGQVTPILETVKEVGQDKAEAYLYARHAAERNAVILERTEGKNAAGSGMTNEQAAAIIRAAESGPHAGRFKALGRRWDALMAQNLEMAVGYKLITPETAKALRERYPHYVPLKTLMDEGERTALGIGKGADIRGPEFKVAMGRGTVADAPLAHGLAALQRTLLRGEKRRILQPLVDLLAEEGGEIPGFVKLRRSNLIEDLPRNVVGLGPDLRLEFEPEYQDFVDAIQNPTGRSIDQRRLLGVITKHVGKLVRTVGGLATRHNPVFPIINALFRDPATAFFISAEHGLAFGVRVVKDGPKAWLAMFGKGSWAKHAETYRSLGGQMATLGMDDVQGHMENIQKLLADPGTFKRGARALVRGLQTYADAGENAMRLSAFVHAQQDLGMAPEQAVFYAKNLTTNFRRKGLAGNYINAWWLFANPGIQGTHRAGQVASNKNVQKLVGSAVAFSAIMDLINRMASDEDEDGVRFYDAIPEYVKRHNMLFTFDGRRYFKIPLPPIFNWFHALGTNLSEEGWDHWMGEDLSGSFVGDMAVAAMDSFNPLGGSDNALSILSPTPTDPAVELAFNEDFAGRSIAKLPFPGQQSPPSEQYWPDVNPTVEAITTKLNEWTGGDKYEAGKVSINPEWVEHLGKFLGSGAGQFLGQLYDIPDKMLRGEPVASADIPLVRRLVQDPSPYALGGRYRDARDEVKLAVKRTDGEPGPPTDKDRPLWALKGALSSTEKQINAKEEKLAKATSPKLKAKLEAEIREIQAKFTRRVHEAKKTLEAAPAKG